MRAPITYYGGKQYMYKKIIALFPLHQTYVEPFGGAASVLLSKEPSPVEVYNDIDGDIVNLFRVLRDRGDELIHKLQLTPYAREEFVTCLENQCDDPVERARRTFVRFRQSFYGKGDTPGRWGYSVSLSRKDKASTVSHWLSAIDEVLPQVIARFREVQIEHSDALDLITRYDTLNTLFYCDPPYISESRVDANSYLNEMTNDEHLQLLKLLLNIKGMAVLSGYHNLLYDSKLVNWAYREFDAVSWSSGKPRTRQGKGGKAPRRTEVVWLNPAAVACRVNSSKEHVEEKQLRLMKGERS